MTGRTLNVMEAMYKHINPNFPSSTHPPACPSKTMKPAWPSKTMTGENASNLPRRNTNQTNLIFSDKISRPREVYHQRWQIITFG